VKHKLLAFNRLVQFSFEFEAGGDLFLDGRGRFYFVHFVSKTVVRQPEPAGTLGAAWATCIDTGGHHTGVVSAMMNTAGNTGAIFSPIIAIYAKNHLGGWNAPLYVMAGLFLIGAICWCLIDPRKSVFV
jgi:hypothetical protein